MANSYDDIGYCCELIYKYIYEKKLQDDYEFKPVVLTEINIDDIKKSKSFDVKPVLSGTIKYLGYFNGKYRFKNKTNASKYAFDISIGSYDTDYIKNVNDLHRSELIGMIARYALCDLIPENIILPIMNFDTSYNIISSFNSELTKPLPLPMKKHALCVNVTEHFTQMNTLNKHIIKNYKVMSLENWKHIWFQLLYTLSMISSRYPQFTHGNLNTHSIKICDTILPNETKLYTIGGNKYELTNIINIVKLSDFEKCNLSDTFINTENPPTQNKKLYYDIMMLMFEIYNILDDVKYTNIDVLNFFDSIIPKNLLGSTEYDYSQKMTIIPTPVYMLNKNNFFSEFIIG